MISPVPVTVEVYHWLMDIVKENLLQTLKYHSVAQIVNEESIRFTADTTLALPYNPVRLSHSKMKQALCEDLFPRRKTVISINKTLFNSYKQALFERSIQVYDIDTNTLIISNRYAVETALWLAARYHGVPMDVVYFDDERLLSELDIDRLIIKALNEVAIVLGHSPTAREYEEHRKQLGGPSLSFIKSVYGTFNDAKALSGLKGWGRGKSKK